MKLTRKEIVVIEMKSGEFYLLMGFIRHCADQNRACLCNADAKIADQMHNALKGMNEI